MRLQTGLLCLFYLKYLIAVVSNCIYISLYLAQIIHSHHNHTLVVVSYMCGHSWADCCQHTMATMAVSQFRACIFQSMNPSFLKGLLKDLAFYV